MLLDSAGWGYVFLAIPLLIYIGLVPFWLRNLPVAKRVFATSVYVVSAAIMVIFTVAFILFYGNCLENCYATKNDEIAMLISSFLIVIFLGCVYLICKSYNKSKHTDGVTAAGV